MVICLILIAIVVGSYVLLKSTDNIKSNYTEETNKNKRENKIENKRENKKTVNEESRNTAWILNAGIILILLSGVIFATTSWEGMSDIIKVSMLLIFILAIFAASYLCERLKVEKSAQALHILGTVFAPLALFFISQNALLGEFLSIQGNGKFIYGLMSVAICLPMFLYSMQKYMSSTYTYLSLSTMSLGLILLVMSFGGNIQVATMISLLFNACVIYKYIDKTHEFKKEEITNFFKYISYVFLVVLVSSVYEINTLADKITYAISFFLLTINCVIMSKKTEDYISSTVAYISLLLTNFSLINILENVNTNISIILIYAMTMLEFIGIYMYGKKEIMSKTFCNICGPISVAIMIVCALAYSTVSLASLVPTILVLIVIEMLIITRKIVLNKTTKAVIEYTVPSLIFLALMLTFNIAAEKLSILNLESAFTIYITGAAFIVWILNNYIKKIDKGYAKGFQEIGLLLMSIPLIMLTFNLSKFEIYKVFVCIICACVYTYSLSKTKEQVLKKVLLNAIYFSIFILCIITVGYSNIKLGLFIALALIIIATMLLNNKAAQSNKYFINFLLIYGVILNLISEQSLIYTLIYSMLCALTLLIYSNKIKDKSIIIPATIILYSELLLTPKIDITYANFAMSLMYILVKLSIVCVYSLIAIRTYIENKKTSNAYTYIYVIFAALSYMFLMKNIVAITGIESEMFQTFMHMHIFLILGIILEKISKQKVWNIAGQTIVYLSLIIAACTNEIKLLEIIFTATMFLLIIMFASSKKNTTLLRGSVTGLISYAVIVSVFGLRQIPWWAYIFALGIVFISVAVYYESKKEKAIKTIKNKLEK